MTKKQTEALDRYQQEHVAFRDMINNTIQVSSEIEETRAREVYAALRKKAKERETEYNEFLVPLREALQVLRDKCKASVAPLYDACTVIDQRVSVYRGQLEARRRELEQQATQAAQQGDSKTAIELVIDANQQAAPAAVKGASLGSTIEVDLIDPALATKSLAHCVASGEPLRSGLQRELLAWGKAEAKRGYVHPGFRSRERAKLSAR